MLPELFHIGPIPVRSFGVMMALTFLMGVFYVRWLTGKRKMDFDPYLTVAYILIFGGVIGARLGYVVLHWSDFSSNLTNIFNPFGSDQFGIAGLNLYGGVALSIISSYAYMKWKSISVLDTFDMFAPTLGFGIGITRVGCFLNGCCYGTPCDLPWGVSYDPGSIPYSVFGSQHLHPSQLYSSAYGLALGFFLHWMWKRRAFTGQLVAILFMVEAVFRFLIEYVRYYEDAMLFNFFGYGATWNQVIGVMLFALGLGIYIYNSRAQSVKLAA